MGLGNGRAIDLAGRRFGLLLVVSPQKSEAHGSFWLCRCDCGADGVFRGKTLLAGRMSCGCLQREMRQTMGARIGAMARRRGAL